MSGATATAIATSVAAAAAGAVVSSALAPKQKMPKLQAPEAPPQAAQAPDQSMGRRIAGKITPTLLGGAAGAGGGVPGSLNLGKNTLLGS